MTKEKGGFLPEGYKEPEGNYMKFNEGENTFRVLSSAVTGYEYWNKDTKPVRSKTPWKTTPKDIQTDNKSGKPTPIKHFWVFMVWSYRAEKAQMLEVTQKGIMSSMKAYIANKQWGDPKGYDFTVTRTGSGIDTEYVTMANPHSPAPEATYDVDLEQIFVVDGDPFKGKEAVEADKKADEEFKDA
jgi:hypothetical protein